MLQIIGNKVIVQLGEGVEGVCRIADTAPEALAPVSGGSLAAQLDQGNTIETYSTKVMERSAEHQAFRRLSPPPVLPQDSWMSIFFPHNDQNSDTLKGFAAGKPLVIEETFPLACPGADLREFLIESSAAGGG